jgi:hypothetical protein
MIPKSLYMIGALAGALIWSAAAQAAPGEATQTALMRSGPSTAYPVIARIPAGAAVDILGCSAWCSLEYGGRDGYVRAGTVVSVAAPPVYSWPDDEYFDDNGPPFDGGFFFGLHGHHDHHGGGHDGGHGGHDGGHGGHHNH